MSQLSPSPTQSGCKWVLLSPIITIYCVFLLFAAVYLTQPPATQSVAIISSISLLLWQGAEEVLTQPPSHQAPSSHR